MSRFRRIATAILPLRSIKCVVWAGAFACLAGTADAQGDWPRVGYLLDEGAPLPEAKLAELLEGKTGILVLQVISMATGRIFSCEGVDSASYGFVPPSNDLAVDARTEPCEVEGSSICFDDPDLRFCVAVRRLPDYGLLFAGLRPDFLAFGETDIEYLRADPAQVLGIVPIDAHRLENPAGEIDFGPVAFSLPAKPAFTLRAGNGFRLGLEFGEGPEDGLRVNTQIIGWPDATSLLSDPRGQMPEDQHQIDALLADWEENYRNRDLAEIYRDDDIRISVYEATQLDLSGGTCIRIREHITSAENTDGPEPKLPETAYFQQVCVTPTGGAHFLITAVLERPESLEDITDFESTSLEILDSLRLGFAPEE